MKKRYLINVNGSQTEVLHRQVVFRLYKIPIIIHHIWDTLYSEFGTLYLKTQYNLYQEDDI